MVGARGWDSSGLGLHSFSRVDGAPGEWWSRLTPHARAHRADGAAPSPIPLTPAASQSLHTEDDLTSTKTVTPAEQKLGAHLALLVKSWQVRAACV